MLSLPEKRLDVSLLVSKKKMFHARGGRDGSLDAKKQLEEDGMEELAAKKSKGSIMVCFLVYWQPTLCIQL